MRLPIIYPGPEFAACFAESNGRASASMAESIKIVEIRGAGMQFENVTAAVAPSFSAASTFVRVACYGVQLAVLGFVGMGAMSIYGGYSFLSGFVPKPVDAPPAFRISASEFANKPATGHVVTSSRLGRAEVVQYGQLNNRGSDLAIVLLMPPKGIGMGTQFVQDLTDINLLRLKRSITMTETHYDLDTRFGEFRATEMRVDADGRWKQCLAFRSRLETPTVYLTGWYCDGSGSKPSPNSLACILDKLTLDRELAVKDADTFMRGRMTKAAYCQAAPVSQTIDVGHRGLSPPSRWWQPSATYRPPYRSY
jgi:hypothetical protein